MKIVAISNKKAPQPDFGLPSRYAATYLHAPAFTMTVLVPPPPPPPPRPPPQTSPYTLMTLKGPMPFVPDSVTTYNVRTEDLTEC